MGEALQQFSCRSTTVGTLHAKSLQGFGYDDVVNQFENRYIAMGFGIFTKKLGLKPLSSRATF